MFIHRPLILVLIPTVAILIAGAIPFGTGSERQAPAGAAGPAHILPADVDGDRDNYEDGLETYLGSDPNDDGSLPEHMAVQPSARWPDIPWPDTCNDGMDNDGDGEEDAADPGCDVPPISPFQRDLPEPGMYGFVATLDLMPGIKGGEAGGPMVFAVGGRQGNAIPIEMVAAELRTADGVIVRTLDPDNVSSGTVVSKDADGNPFFPATTTLNGWTNSYYNGVLDESHDNWQGGNDNVYCLPPVTYPLPCGGHVVQQACGYEDDAGDFKLCLEWPADAALDSDGDGYYDELETALGSNAHDAASIPEHMAVHSSARFPSIAWPDTCSDGEDNDLDGNTDGADAGCDVPPLAPFEGAIPGAGVYGFMVNATAVIDSVSYDLAGPMAVRLEEQAGDTIPFEILALQLRSEDGQIAAFESPPHTSLGEVTSKQLGGPMFPAQSTVDIHAISFVGGGVWPPYPAHLTNDEVHCLPPVVYPQPCMGHVQQQDCYTISATAGIASLCPEWSLLAPTPTPVPGQQVTWGDVNCAGGVSSVDSLGILRHVAQMSPLGQTEPCPDVGAAVELVAGSPHTWGDVDCAGGVSSVDSLKILRTVASLPVSQPPGCPEIGGEVAVREP